MVNVTLTCFITGKEHVVSRNALCDAAAPYPNMLLVRAVLDVYFMSGKAYTTLPALDSQFP